MPSDYGFGNQKHVLLTYLKNLPTNEKARSHVYHVLKILIGILTVNPLILKPPTPSENAFGN